MNSPYGGSKTDPHSCLDGTKGPKGENELNEKNEKISGHFSSKRANIATWGGGLVNGKWKALVGFKRTDPGRWPGKFISVKRKT